MQSDRRPRLPLRTRCLQLGNHLVDASTEFGPFCKLILAARLVQLLPCSKEALLELPLRLYITPVNETQVDGQ